MDVVEVFNRLKELGKVSTFSASEKAEIEAFYPEVLDKALVKTSCNDCYRDAVYEMYAYLKKNGKMKEKTVYKLKNGALLQMGFGSGEFYTNANLTDVAAERFLKRFPERINLFAIYPEDWMERVNKADKDGKAIKGSKVIKGGKVEK